jgi:hypothetical protein
MEEYSCRELIRISNKLPALSDLAPLVQLAVDSQYAAGLWVNDFPSGPSLAKLSLGVSLSLVGPLSAGLAVKAEGVLVR